MMISEEELVLMPIVRKTIVHIGNRNYSWANNFKSKGKIPFF